MTRTEIPTQIQIAAACHSVQDVPQDDRRQPTCQRKRSERLQIRRRCTFAFSFTGRFNRPRICSHSPLNTNADACCSSLWGSPGHLAQVSKALQSKFEKSNLHVLVAKRNIGNFTYDGIELGAERVTNEIEDELADLDKQGKKVTKFSAVGYSFGGLIARYCIGLLHSKGYFDRMQPLVCPLALGFICCR